MSTANLGCAATRHRVLSGSYDGSALIWVAAYPLLPICLRAYVYGLRLPPIDLRILHISLRILHVCLRICWVMSGTVLA
eukprot:2437312-Rhodomonas_salina.4